LGKVNKRGAVKAERDSFRPCEPDPDNAGVGREYIRCTLLSNSRVFYFYGGIKMKKVLIFAMLCLTVMSFSRELTVYTYESMDWIEDHLISQFEERENCKVKVITLGDGGNVLSRLILEKKRPQADVVVGLDQSMSVKAIENDLLLKFVPSNLDNITNPDLIFDATGHVYPYDFGAIAIITNPSEMKGTIHSFEALKELEDALIIQDPRSSSTGQSFLLWTIAIYGENWQQFWREIKPSILTVTSGWSEAFSKFEAGEAPMMVSYATDGAYSVEYYGSTTYTTLIPDEGAYVQIEGAGIVKGTDDEILAGKFIEFLLSDEVQRDIPLNQWMFPVTDVEMPESFDYAVKPEKILSIDASEIGENLEKWLDEWEQIMY